jgi:hypothetical protein
MYFQEMIDQDQTKLEYGFSSFDGGYQALLKLLAKSKTIPSYTTTYYSSPPGSYSKRGTYKGKDDKNYGFLAYTLYVYTKQTGIYYSTLLTIWDTDTLGDFNGFYGNDLGTHENYRYSPRNLGRNFSCVITKKGVILINLHGPNVPSFMSINDQKLGPAIEYFIEEACTEFEIKTYPPLIFDEKLVVIGGDTNDVLDKMRQVKFRSATYKYEGEVPLSCCAEDYDDVLVDLDGKFKPYKYYSDKFLFYYDEFTKDELKLFKNQLVIETIPEELDPPRTLAYGGHRPSCNIKKKKSLKKKKTIKKRHYKLKKNSLKKRRMFR